MAAPLIIERPQPIGRAVAVPKGVERAVPRLAAIDNLRVFLTALVIAHHAGQPYGPTGGDWPLFNDERARILGPFFGVNAAFFMGLFFLISGYFLPMAYDRKGAGAFLRDRAMRLGLPLVCTSLIIFGPLSYFMDYAGSPGATESTFWGYFFRVYLGHWRVEFAHLWFVAHLLVYALAYAAWRLAPRNNASTRRPLPPPGYRALALYTAGLALVNAVVRSEFPQDRWVRPFGVPIEPAHLPQYLSLFVLGIVAARNDWLRRLPTGVGLRLLAIGLGAAGLVYADRLVGGLLPLPEGADLLVWSSWEAIICVGLCVGLPVLAREFLNRQGPLLHGLTANAYAAYILHLWPVVGLQFALADAPLPPLTKFAIVCVVGIPSSFALGWLVRRVPGVGRVL